MGPLTGVATAALVGGGQVPLSGRRGLERVVCAAEGPALIDTVRVQGAMWTVVVR